VAYWFTVFLVPEKNPYPIKIKFHCWKPNRFGRK
jgi:hypothetical protein